MGQMGSLRKIRAGIEYRSGLVTPSSLCAPFLATHTHTHIHTHTAYRKGQVLSNSSH